MPREINQAGYDIAHEFEQGPNGGPALLPYLCPAGVWTDGWGNTKNVAPGRRITREQADAQLDRNLDECEAWVDKHAPGANDNEFSAMVLLTFNIGLEGFRGSTVCRLHNKGDKVGAARAFRMWNKATVNGKLTELPGLTRRRLAEEALYLTPETGAVFQEQAMPQAVTPPPTMATSKTGWTAGGVVVAGAGTLAEQLDADKVAVAVTAVESLTDSAQSVMKVVTTVGPIVLAVVIVGGAAFILIRHWMQKRAGRVQS